MQIKIFKGNWLPCHSKYDNALSEKFFGYPPAPKYRVC